LLAIEGLLLRYVTVGMLGELRAAAYQGMHGEPTVFPSAGEVAP
jgi:hypothetical protein